MKVTFSLLKSVTILRLLKHKTKEKLVGYDKMNKKTILLPNSSTAHKISARDGLIRLLSGSQVVLA